jgi:4-hydroxy-2-oxoheptanedioate aldolase
VRGVGAGLARASDFNRVGDYLTTAEQELCLLLQIETLKGIDALDAILRCDGVDGVFVGPSDLAADMGYLGKPSVPEVQAVVEETIARIVRSGKPAGILTADLDLARRYLDLGASFVAVGSDIALLARGAENLAHRFKNPAR